jgi:hypothetical protein
MFSVFCSRVLIIIIIIIIIIIMCSSDNQYVNLVTILNAYIGLIYDGESRQNMNNLTMNHIRDTTHARTHAPGTSTCDHWSHQYATAAQRRPRDRVQSATHVTCVCQVKVSLYSIHKHHLRDK